MWKFLKIRGAAFSRMLIPLNCEHQAPFFLSSCNGKGNVRYKNEWGWKIFVHAFDFYSEIEFNPNVFSFKCVVF